MFLKEEINLRVELVFHISFLFAETIEAYVILRCHLKKWSNYHCDMIVDKGGKSEDMYKEELRTDIMYVGEQTVDEARRQNDRLPKRGFS